MSFHTYQNWDISINSSEGHWIFRVYPAEGEPLSDCSLHQSPEEALRQAQQYIDRQIKRQRIVAVLDTLLEKKEIDAELYIQLVRYLRDS